MILWWLRDLRLFGVSSRKSMVCEEQGNPQGRVDHGPEWGWYCFHFADPGVSVSSHWPFTLRVLIKASPWEERLSKCSTLTKVKCQGNMSGRIN